MSQRLQAPTAGGPDAASEFARLVEIMRLLRSPEGCPWDREQTWQTLAPFVLEEASEVVDAIERDDGPGLMDEIGDLVFEGVFLARVAEDAGRFSLADSLESVCEKLVRRHPHVFEQTDGIAGTDGAGVETAPAVIEQWHQIKAREHAAAGRARTGLLEDVPVSLPALARAGALGQKAARVGFDWPDPAAVLDKVREEIDELQSATATGAAAEVREELGDLLFALAQFARKAGVDPEAALRGANRKFTGRFHEMERRVADSGRALSDVPLGELEAVWQDVKRSSR
jgi:MazG family protein